MTNENDVEAAFNVKFHNEIQADQNGEKNVKDQMSTSGRLVVYGDSNCIDDNHLQKCMYYKKNINDKIL